MNRAYILLLPLWLFVALGVHAQTSPPSPLQLGADTPWVSGAGALSFLRDATGKKTADEVMADAGAWQALPGELAAGYTKDAIWLRLTLARAASAPADWLLLLGNALLDEATLFRLEADGRWTRADAGENVARDAWPLATRSPAFPLALPETRAVTLLLRLESKNAMSSTVEVWQRDAFDDFSRRESLHYGLYFGCYLLLIVLHAFFWRMTREAQSGWYLLYVSLAAGIQMLTVGFPQMLFGIPVALSDPLLACGICVALAVATRFAVLQLDLASVWPRFSKAVVGAATLVSLVTAGLVLTVDFAAGIVPAQLAALLMAPLLMGTATLLLLRGHPPAKFYLFAFGIYYAGVYVSFLRNMGVFPPNVWTNNAASFGSLIHMLLMSLRLHASYDTLRAQAGEAVRRLNEGLEQEVAARTADLEREIAWRKLTENELAAALEAERRIREEQRSFAGMVSHEFRSPLAIINVTAQQIARNPEAPWDEVTARCKNLRDAVRRMSDMVDTYLVADRMETAEPVFCPQPCRLPELIGELVREWPAGRICVSLQRLPEDFVCDPALLKVALRNLLANADRHAPPEEAVLLHAAGAWGGGVRIEVQNGGEPIPADDVPRLFEKYFRGRLSQHRPGAGLGLHLVRRIARIHGGTVTLASAGATDEAAEKISFVLFLPGPADAGETGACEKETKRPAE